jgi:hypothetical protein
MSRRLRCELCLESRRSGACRKGGIVAAFRALLFVAVIAFASSAAAQAPAPPAEWQDIRDQLMLLSGGAAEVVARALQMTEIAGKPLDVGDSPGKAQAPKLEDIAVARGPAAENEPTIATNPRDKKRLVAGSHRGSVCTAYISADGGATWTSGTFMPLRPTVVFPPSASTSTCSDPVIVYAPDGSRVYYAYMDIQQTVPFPSLPPPFNVTQDFDIVISYSDDNGATWSSPVIALDGDPFTIRVNPPPTPPTPLEGGFLYDKPWIGTAVQEGDSEFVYVTATRFRQLPQPSGFPPGAIAFARSTNQGLAWSTPVLLDAGSDSIPPSTPAVVVQGSRPAGGLNGDVLVAWYHSGFDGFLNGQFQIRTRRSGDHGVTWDPVAVASLDLYETRFFLGPLDFYRRWWPVMMPDVEIGADGVAHIAYTHTPVNLNLPENATSTEQGDIRYISSTLPYSSWSAPVTINDDASGRAQGFAALKMQRGGGSSTIHVIWEDTRLSPDLAIPPPASCFTGPTPTRNCDSPNLFYDIFYAKHVPGRGVGWFDNFRLSDTSSIQDFTFSGDYIDLAANDRLLFGIWTDRRDQTSVFSPDDDIFAGGWGIVPAKPLFTQTFDVPDVACDGLQLDGVSYVFSVAGVPSADCRAGTNAGPGITNNIVAPNMEGSAAGVLSLKFDHPTADFGFGVAQSTAVSPQSVIIDLFGPGGVRRQELALDTTRDPNFVGGRFDYEGPAVRAVTIRFSGASARFVIDNVTYFLAGNNRK